MQVSGFPSSDAQQQVKISVAVENLNGRIVAVGHRNPAVVQGTQTLRIAEFRPVSTFVANSRRRRKKKKKE